MPPWEFERDGEMVRIDPTGPLIVRAGGATDLAVNAAITGAGIVYLFEEWLRPHLNGVYLDASSSHRGSTSPGRSSTFRDVASCPHRCGRSADRCRPHGSP